MKKLMPAIAGVLMLAACGGGAPVAQYVVNIDQQKVITKGNNAQCSDADPQNDTKTTTVKADDILSIYEEKDGTSYAEYLGHVYTGKKTGDTYSLVDSQSVEDTRPAGNNNPRDAVQSDVYTLNVKKDGDFVTGSLNLEHHQSCAGSGCDQVEAQTIDCNYSQNLRGRKLPDQGTLSVRNQVGQ